MGTGEEDELDAVGGDADKIETAGDVAARLVAAFVRFGRLLVEADVEGTART